MFRSKIILSVLLFLCTNFSLAQNQPWHVAKQIHISKSYDEIVEIPDGYIVAGEWTNSINLKMISNSSDTVIWEKSYGNYGTEKLALLRSSADGVYIICTVNSKFSNIVDDNDIWVAKVDFDGNLIWEQFLGGSLEDKVNGAVVSENGDLFIGGYSRISSQNISQDFYIARISKDGNIIYEKTHRGEESNEDFLDQRIDDLIISNNGELVAIGADEIILEQGADWITIGDKFSIVHFSLDEGSLITLHNSDFITSPSRLLQSVDDNLIAASGYSDIILAKFDFTSGDLIWESGIQGNGSDFLEDAIILEDGNIAVVGHSDSDVGNDFKDFNKSNNGSTQAMVGLFSAEGDLQWVRSYYSQYDNYIVDIEQTDAGKLIGISNRNLDNFGTVNISGSYTNIIEFENISDTEKPTKVASIDVTNLSACGMTLSWPSSQDNIGVMGYYLYIDDDLYTTADTTVSISVTENQTIDARLMAMDLSLNLSDTHSIQIEVPKNIKDQTALIKSFGGNKTDELNDIERLDDGKIVLVGSTYSSASDNSDISTDSYGADDGLILVVDANSEVIRDQRLGGKSYDNIVRVNKTSDGLIYWGESQSDVLNYSGDALRGRQDIYITKTDFSGNIIWQKMFGGIGKEEVYDAQVLADQSMILIAGTESPISGDITSEPVGDSISFDKHNRDIIIFGFDSEGNKQWEKRLGGSSVDYYGGSYIYDDGEIALLFNISSNASVNEISQPAKGNLDIGMLLLGANQNIVSSARFGAPNEFLNATSIFPDQSGNLIIGAYTAAEIGGDVGIEGYGESDYWVFKTDIFGTIQNEMRFGGEKGDFLDKIIFTQDGNLLLSGNSYSGKSGNKESANKGTEDIYLLEVNMAGEILWQESYGGPGEESTRALIETSSGEYLIGGISKSNSCDIFGNNGNVDFLLIKHNKDKDNTPPSIVENLDTLNVTVSSAGIKWDAATDNYGVAFYKVYQGDKLLAKIYNGSNKFEQMGDYKDKTLNFEVSAVDYARNEGPKAAIEFDVVLSLDYSSENQINFKAYPVPFFDEVKLVVPHESGSIQELKIYNSKGVLVYDLSHAEMILTQSGMEVKLSEDYFPESGVYFVHLISDKGQSVRRLIKMN